MCKCLWGTSAKRTGVCFLLGIDTFAVVHVDEIRKNRSYTRLDSQIANVYGKWENDKIWKNSKSCRQDLETLHLASKIWKILNLVGKICKILNLLGKICKKFKNVPARFGKFKNIWRIQNPSCKTRKIQDLAGKIWNFQYLVTHHSLTRPSNSRRMTFQLAGPNLFWLLCFVV